MQIDPEQNDSNDRPPGHDQIQQRQVWKIALAIFLIWIAVSSTSDANNLCLVADCVCQEPTGLPIQYDGFTPLPGGCELVLQDSGSIVAFVQLQAELSNFDADADPDGWRAAVALGHRDGRRLATPSHATFEILEYARPSHRLSTGQRVAHSTPLMRWTMPLVFDDQGVATVTLAASRWIRSSFGWDSIGAHQVGSDRVERRLVGRHVSSGNHRLGGGRMSRLTGPRYNQYFVTLDLQDAIDFPTIGWLRVRVTIPGQQTVQAVAPIDLRPPVLVDTQGRYR